MRVGASVSVGEATTNGVKVAVGSGVHVWVGVALWEKSGKRAANPLLSRVFPIKISAKSKIMARVRKNGQRRGLGAGLGGAGGTLRVMVRVFPATMAAGMGGRGSRRSLVGLALARAFSRASISAAPVW